LSSVKMFAIKNMDTKRIEKIEVSLIIWLGFGCSSMFLKFIRLIVNQD
jgi:hypothetical protein